MFLPSFTDISCKIIFNQYPADYYWGTDSSPRGISMEYGFFVNVFLDLSSKLYGDILIILCEISTPRDGWDLQTGYQFL